jgi:hypothetical protein
MSEPLNNAEIAALERAGNELLIASSDLDRALGNVESAMIVLEVIGMDDEAGDAGHIATRLRRTARLLDDLSEAEF